MINLREMTLMYRVKYYVDGSTSTIKKALGCLERYFFLLAFCSYVSEQAASEYRIMFSSWIKSRTGMSFFVYAFCIAALKLTHATHML